MNIYERLEKDHRAVEDIFEQILDSSDGAKKTREKLFSKLKSELIAHSKAEEKIFYPRLKEEGELREQVLESLEEHHEVELLLDELDELEVDDERWMAKMRVLQENVEHHVEEEEDELFEEARSVLDDDEATDLCKRFDEEKSQLLDGKSRRKAA